MGKIGDVNIERIPPGQHVDCEGCSETATSYRNGVAYCADCLLTEQQKAWKNEVSFVNSEGEVVEYEIVENFPRDKKGTGPTPD